MHLSDLRALAITFALVVTTTGTARAHRAPACRSPDADALDLHDRLARIATSDEPGPRKMRLALGVTATPLTPPDSILLASDTETCRRGGEAYAKAYGPDATGKGVFVMHFGEFWVVARP